MIINFLLYIKKDLFLIDSVGLKISNNLNSGKNQFKLHNFWKKIFSLFVGIALAKFFSSNNKKVHIINYCKPARKSFLFLKRICQVLLINYQKITKNLSYSETTIYPNMEEPDLTSEIDKKDIVITITQQASSEVNSIHQIFKSDYFLICGIKEKTYFKENSKI